MDTPRTARLRRKDHWSRALLRAIANADCSQTEVSRLLGVSGTKVRHWCDPEHATGIPLSDLEALPAPVVLPLLRLVAERHGYTLSPMQCEGGNLSELLSQTAALSKEHGEAIGAVMASMADGTLTEAEREVCLRELEETDRALGAVIGTLRSTRQPPPSRKLKSA